MLGSLLLFSLFMHTSYFYSIMFTHLVDTFVQITYQCGPTFWEKSTSHSWPCSSCTFKTGEALIKDFYSRLYFSPDASAVGPVTGHSGAGQQGGHGLVKQEVISDQLLLLGVGHAVQRVVLSLELTVQAGQG